MDKKNFENHVKSKVSNECYKKIDIIYRNDKGYSNMSILIELYKEEGKQGIDKLYKELFKDKERKFVLTRYYEGNANAQNAYEVYCKDYDELWNIFYIMNREADIDVLHYGPQPLKAYRTVKLKSGKDKEYFKSNNKNIFFSIHGEYFYKAVSYNER